MTKIKDKRARIDLTDRTEPVTEIRPASARRHTARAITKHAQNNLRWRWSTLTISYCRSKGLREEPSYLLRERAAAARNWSDLYCEPWASSVAWHSSNWIAQIERKQHQTGPGSKDRSSADRCNPNRSGVYTTNQHLCWNYGKVHEAHHLYQTETSIFRWELLTAAEGYAKTESCSWK